MPKNAARTLADFRAVHSRDVVVPNKIRAALASLAKEGAEAWEYESDFIRRAGVSQKDMGDYREQFLKYIVTPPALHGKTTRRAWFASEKVAREARGGDAE